MVKDAIKKADVLIEALPYIKEFHNKIFVIKYGGSILGEDKVRKNILDDLVFLRFTGIKPILVHGGGPSITERLKSLKVTSEFVDGIRVTDELTLKIAEEELNKLNDMIVNELNYHGDLAKGFKTCDRILKTIKKTSEKDLGFVGEIVDCDIQKLKKAMENHIPVISPMGISDDNITYNINGDEVAFFLASRLKAEKIVFLTEVLGVMRDPNDEHTLIPTITAEDLEELYERKIITGGMIPKVKAAVQAIKNGAGKAHIVDAKIPHAILLEIFTNEGIGTEIIS